MDRKGELFIAHINDNDEIQTVAEHCRKTAEYASGFLDSSGLKAVGYLSGIFHDAGKCTEEFNEYIRRAHNNECVKRGSVIHSFAGVRFFLDKYHKGSDVGLSELTAEIIACSIGNHHGLFDIYDENRKSGLEYRLEKQPEYDQRAIENFFSCCINENDEEKLFSEAISEIGDVYEKIVHKLCKSGDDSELMFYLGMVVRLVSSAVIDGDRLDTASYMKSVEYISEMKMADGTLWNNCLSSLGNMLDSLHNDTDICTARKELSDICEKAAYGKGGIYRLNLPTGAGKTLSGLRFALRHAEQNGKKRIIFVTPLLSILDQNSETIKEAIGNDSIILEHHSNIIHEKNEGEDISRYDLLTETWNSPIIITTLVQLLNTLFDGRTSSVRRFHSLCDSIIIIDEVQTVPVKMLTLFNLAVNFLTEICGTTVVMCSATQPEFKSDNIKHRIVLDMKDIVPSESMKKYREVFRRNKIVDAGNYTIAEMAKFVNELSESCNSVLVVCNKKSQAKELFGIVSKNISCLVYHLSASMCPEHRNKILNEIKDKLLKKEKLVCISTQVIEAGVDVSFEAAVRFTAGLDSIVQTAGRCNRNGIGEKDSSVYAVKCVGESLKNLDDMKQQQNATAALFEYFRRAPERYGNDLSSESSVTSYYEEFYKQMSKGQADFSVKGYPSVFELLSDNGHYSEKNDKYFMTQAFKTAGTLFEVFDNRQQTIIVPFEEGRDIAAELFTDKALHDIKYAAQIIEKAKPYCVSLFDYQIKWLENNKGITYACDGRAAVLSGDYYSNETGVIFSENEESDGLCSILTL